MCLVTTRFVTVGARLPSDLHVAFSYLTGRRYLASASASVFLRSPCGINNLTSLNPNLASPAADSERHRWYMCLSGRLWVLSFLSVMDGDFCRPVNTQSEPHCPDLRCGGTRVTLTKARRFNHSEQQLYSARIGARVCGWCLCVSVPCIKYIAQSSAAVITERSVGRCSPDRVNFSSGGRGAEFGRQRK